MNDNSAHSFTEGSEYSTYKLLPCPFCGQEPQWVNKLHTSGLPGLKCFNCGYTKTEDRIDKTVGMWNMRHGVQQPKQDTYTIKPLEWTEWKAKPARLFFKSETSVGEYTITQSFEGETMWSDSPYRWIYAKGIEEAKQAAFDHYKERLLPCLNKVEI